MDLDAFLANQADSVGKIVKAIEDDPHRTFKYSELQLTLLTQAVNALMASNIETCRRLEAIEVAIQKTFGKKSEFEKMVKSIAKLANDPQTGS